MNRFHRLPVLTVLVALLTSACAPPEQRAGDFVARAQSSFDKGDFTAARLQAKNALQIEPRNAEARYLLALTFEQEGNLRETIGNLLLAVDGDPTNVQAQLKLGYLFFYAENFAEAARYAEAVAALAPENAELGLLEARLLFQKQDFPAGLDRLDAVLDNDSANLDALSLKAIALARGDSEAALTFIDEALPGLDPASTQALRRIRLSVLGTRAEPAVLEAELQALARDFPDENFYTLELIAFYRNQGRLDEAEALIRDLIRRNPDDMDARLGLVQFLAQNRDVEQAEEVLRAFVAEFPAVPQFTQALGRRYDTSGRTSEAVELYRDFARRDPRSPAGLAARREIAIIAFREGRTDEGRAEIEALLEEVPDDAQALVMRASLSADEGQQDDAIADLRMALRRQPESQTALLLLARTYTRAGNFTLAADSYRQLLAVNPRHPEAPAELAPLLAAQGDLTATADMLEQQLRVTPDDLLALGRLAELRLQQRDPGAAETLARRIMAVSDQQGIGEFVLGRALLAQGKAEPAITAFRSSRAERPDDLLVREGLVQALVAAGRPEEAIRQLDADLLARPDDTAALYLLGSLYARQGDLTAARPRLEAAITAQPDVPAYYEARAALEVSPEARLDIYRRGIAVLPRDPLLGLRLGESYVQAARIDEAIAAFEAVLGANPGYLPALNNLAALLLDYRENPESWRRALELATPLEATRDPLFLDTLGWAHYRNAAYPQAVRTLERAVALNGQLAVLRYHLGMAYLAAGNEAGARQELSRAVELGAGAAAFPGLNEAREALARLDG